MCVIYELILFDKKLNAFVYFISYLGIFFYETIDFLQLMS